MLQTRKHRRATHNLHDIFLASATPAIATYCHYYYAFHARPQRDKKGRPHAALYVYTPVISSTLGKAASQKAMQYMQPTRHNLTPNDKTELKMR